MFSLSPIGSPAQARPATPRFGAASPAVEGTPPDVRSPVRATLMHVTDAYRALLDASSAINPIVPMIFVPGGRLVQPNFDAARGFSGLGLAAIERALKIYPAARNEARTALETAAVDARRGHAELSHALTHGSRVDSPGVVAAIGAATALLRTAGQLLATELRDPKGFRPFGTS